jgi:hypothetical protein
MISLLLLVFTRFIMPNTEKIQAGTKFATPFTFVIFILLVQTLLPMDKT